jgi:hypothetical protein
VLDGGDNTVCGGLDAYIEAACAREQADCYQLVIRHRRYHAPAGGHPGRPKVYSVVALTYRRSPRHIFPPPDGSSI